MPKTLFNNSKGVTNLSPSDFIRLPNGTIALRNVKPGEVGFVMFYADWCPHCHHMVPAFNELGKLIGDKAVVGVFNCADDSSELYKETAKAANVEFYPTIKFVNGTHLEPYNGGKKVQDFLKYLCDHTAKFCEY